EAAGKARARSIPPSSTKGDDMSGYSRRDFLKTSVMIGTALGTGLGFPRIVTSQTKEPIKVGVLHSLSGTMAISEVSLRDVVLMAVEGIKPKAGPTDPH